MYHLYSNYNYTNVTGVTGLLRACYAPRNTVKALSHLHFRHLVTAVTGLCVCARGCKKYHLINSINFILINISPCVKKTARNNRNNRNNYCFIYIYILDTRNKLNFWCNKQSLTRNNCLKIQQGC